MKHVCGGGGGVYMELVSFFGGGSSFFFFIYILLPPLLCFFSFFCVCVFFWGGEFYVLVRVLDYHDGNREKIYSGVGVGFWDFGRGGFQLDLT